MTDKFALYWYDPDLMDAGETAEVEEKFDDFETAVAWAEETLLGMHYMLGDEIYEFDEAFTRDGVCAFRRYGQAMSAVIKVSA